MPTFQYSDGIIEWMKENVKKMDQKTRKIITMYSGLYPGSNLDWLHLQRSKGGMGLVED